MPHPNRLPGLLSLLSIVVALAGCNSAPVEGTGLGASASSTMTEPMTASDGDTQTSGPTSSGSGVTSTSTGSSTGSMTGSTTGSTTESITEPTTSTSTTTADDTSTGAGTDTGDTTTGGNGLWNAPNLWYSVDTALIYVEIDPLDGSVVQLVHNQLVPDAPLWHGQNGLTMLPDGTLLGSRESDAGTQIFHVPNPPTTADTPAQAVFLGIVPGDGDEPPRIEALYTDCDGRIYLMDTGNDTSSAEGNRLLRFNGEFLAGDLGFEVITDLQNASVADIDDMSPGIVDGEISDGVGFAMDSSVLWRIDYTNGTGMQLAQTGGSWGIHALGGPLFKDLSPRLYILGTNAELMEVYLGDYSDSPPLLVGPDLELDSGYNGWSGLAGPLTECETTIPG